MTSIVSICNLALSNIGKDNIAALNEPNPEARACRQFYGHVRDMLLQAYPWRFAGRTISLAELANDKPGAWGHAYARPTDCLKVRYVRGAYSETDLSAETPVSIDGFGARHEIEGQTIYTDLSPAFLRYTFRAEDTSKYPPLFTEAFGWHLAVRLAMPLTRDPSVRRECFNVANGMQSEAQMADANEERDTSDISSELVEARG